MSEFRTPDEVQKVYDERGEAGQDSQPYVLEYDSAGKRLIFFGSVHSSDPNHSQWQQLDSSFKSFITNPNPDKIVFCEGRIDGSEEPSNDEALRKFGESGLVSWMAHQQRVETECPEPGRAEEIKALRGQFSIPEIVTYYFGRQMHQWVRQDNKVHPDWQAYAEDALGKYASLQAWDGQKFDLPQAIAWFKEQTGKDFDPHDTETLYKLSDPAQSEVSAASGTFRDEKLLEAIKAKWQSGSDIFVIYGSGHAIRLEPVLEQLTGGKARANYE